jgi:hypothetical protein
LRLFTALSIGLLASVVACRGGEVETPVEGPRRLLLKPLGPVSQQAYPTQSVTLKVIALEAAESGIEDSDDLSRAIGQAIGWRVTSGGAGVLLSATATATNESGIAEITVQLGDDDGTVQILAETTGADPVTFSVNVWPDARRIELLGPANLNVMMERTELIRARLARPSEGGMPGAPIAGGTVTVKLVGGAREGARIQEGDGTNLTLTSDSAGMLSLRFVTGSLPDVSYRLEFCGSGSCPGTESKNLTISVKRLITSDEPCVYFTDCDTGFVCTAGTCRPAAQYCDTNAQCNPGFDCSPVTRTCEPHVGAPCDHPSDCAEDEICGAGGMCIPEDGCTSNPDCPSGWTCELTTGICKPPSDKPAINVAGSWQTKYHFDISDTLGPFITESLGPVVNILNMIFISDLEIDIPLIGNILEVIVDAMVKQYVADWVKNIVAFLSDFINVFKSVTADGEMELVQSPTSPVLGTAITGQEKWTAAHLRVKSLCCRYNTNQTDYTCEQKWETDPTCGQVNVLMEKAVYGSTDPDDDFTLGYSDNALEVGTIVPPFNGEVYGTELRLRQRSVRLEFRQFINVVLDLVVGAASKGQYSFFKDFLSDIVPCSDVASYINGVVSDLTGGDIAEVTGLEQHCDAEVEAAILAFEEWIGDQPIELHMVFDQKALIHDPYGIDFARTFGDSEHPENNAESSMLGGTALWEIFGGDLDDSSWWHGRRAGYYGDDYYDYDDDYGDYYGGY